MIGRKNKLYQALIPWLGSSWQMAESPARLFHMQVFPFSRRPLPCTSSPKLASYFFLDSDFCLNQGLLLQISLFAWAWGLLRTTRNVLPGGCLWTFATCSRLGRGAAPSWSGMNLALSPPLCLRSRILPLCWWWLWDSGTAQRPHLSRSFNCFSK